MTGQILLTIAITIGALGLFVWDRIRADVVGIIVMTVLILSGLVTINEGLSGFANEAMVTVAAMFVLSAGLVRTGGIDLLGKWVARLAGKSEFRLLLVSIAIVVPLSAFINNTPVVVVMIPLVLGLSRKIGARSSKLLMPISFASQLGGSLTLIGTSTNLLVAGLVLEMGMERIGLFQVTPAALVLTVIGVAYLLTFGRWLAPVRVASADLISAYDLREYSSVLIVQPESPVVGLSIGDVRFASEYGFQILAIDRKGHRIDTPGPSTILHADDSLVVRGKVQDLAKVEEIMHLKIATPEEGPEWGPTIEGEAEGIAENGELPVAPESGVEVSGGRPHLAEVMVPPRSRVVGRTIRELNFRSSFGVPVLGMERHGTPIVTRMRDVQLAPGDLLLVRGDAPALNRIHERRDLALLGPLEIPARRLGKLRIAVFILAVVVTLAALNIVPILVSALGGVIAMFLTGCVTPDEAYEEVDWMVLVLLGSIIPLGIAMQNTGTAEFIASQLLQLTSPMGLFGTLAAFYLLTSLLTEMISNNAAAILLTPIAIASAGALGADPLPFVVAVMIAASNSFMTPIGYQTNTFVYGPGGYRFGDFFRVGAPLNLILILTATFVIPHFFPF
jgi:di/tricarboxylate transporter